VCVHECVGEVFVFCLTIEYRFQLSLKFTEN
jgi:hypothetical protein